MVKRYLICLITAIMLLSTANIGFSAPGDKFTPEHLYIKFYKIDLYNSLSKQYETVFSSDAGATFDLAGSGKIAPFPSLHVAPGTYSAIRITQSRNIGYQASSTTSMGYYTKRYTGVDEGTGKVITDGRYGDTGNLYCVQGEGAGDEITIRLNTPAEELPGGVSFSGENLLYEQSFATPLKVEKNGTTNINMKIQISNSLVVETQIGSGPGQNCYGLPPMLELTD